MSVQLINGGTDALWSIYRSGNYWHWEAFWCRDRLDGWEETKTAALEQAKKWARVIEGRAHSHD